jgi:hypothetical protein
MGGKYSRARPETCRKVKNGREGCKDLEEQSRTLEIPEITFHNEGLSDFDSEPRPVQRHKI